MTTEERSPGPVVGGCRGKDKPGFDNASLIDRDSFQVSCRFTDLIIVHCVRGGHYRNYKIADFVV